MGCVNSASAEDVYALERRVRVLEEKSNGTSEFTEAKLLQALSEKYGAASNELIRLQTLLQTLEQSNALIAAASGSIEKANEITSVHPLQLGQPFVADRIGLVILVAYRYQNLVVQKKGGEVYSIDCPSDAINILASVIQLALPGDTFTWMRNELLWTRRPANLPNDSTCYFVALK